MEVFVSKLLVQLISPLSLFIWMAILAGVAVWLERKRLAVALLSTAVTLLWIVSTPACSNYYRAGLERTYLPLAVSESPTADAIVLLGGAVSGPLYPRITADLQGGSDRVLHAARLYRAGKAPIVIATGGNIPWLDGTGPEAPVLSGLLQEWGVPHKAVVIEPDSVNTRENAINTQQILLERGLENVLLVTSALHMPRALATFQAVGVKAVPSPTDYEVVERQTTIIDLLPKAQALAGTTRAIHEYLGYLVYWLRGWI